MAKVKLGFSKLTVPNKIQQARNILIQMAASGNFVTPTPTLAIVGTATDTLETAFEDASKGGTVKTAFMHLQEKNLVKLMAQLASYVQTTSQGDETIILSSGMDVAATPSAPQQLLAPEALAIYIGQNESDALLKWKTLKGAKAYVIQQSTDGNTNWAEAGHCTKATIIISGLTSGAKIWFRTAGIGPKGLGPWSSPARGMAA
jgi:hypothetical protein